MNERDERGKRGEGAAERNKKKTERRGKGKRVMTGKRREQTEVE